MQLRTLLEKNQTRHYARRAHNQNRRRVHGSVAGSETSTQHRRRVCDAKLAFGRDIARDSPFEDPLQFKVERRGRLGRHPSPAEDLRGEVRRQVSSAGTRAMLYSIAGTPRDRMESLRSPLSASRPPFPWTSPRSGVIYSIRENDDASRGLCLRADAEADVRKIYWFADKAFLGSAAAREALNWHPTPGAHKIVALDDYGRSNSCTVTVQPSDVN